MWILPLLGYAGAILGFCFLTLSIASGLYYLSELVEEHTVLAKRLLTRLIQIIIGVQVVLWLIDGFPFWATVLGILDSWMQRVLMLTWILVLVLLDHYVWFRHFADSQARAYNRTSYYEQVDVPTFTMIASYFGLCVWLVPFALFVSLSAGDNVLPTMGTEPVRGMEGKSKPQGMVKAVVDWVRGLIGDMAGSGMDRP
ncbi:hypothetical protein THARTR1_08005 [Trichoderma harzianum]|uniref:Transmembrane adaptor Erv26 n=1 Tax=Trichoderma harzianum TaxID=5544 RepID=A0A2K0U0Q2_TRIHA|nr:hypothetical protein THARTR1_08005 [Trichoderma harzianum]